jgi:Sel1 repeat/MYND finger
MVDRPFLLRDFQCPRCHSEVMKDRSCAEENVLGRFWCCGTACCYQCSWDISHNFHVAAADVNNRLSRHTDEHIAQLQHLRKLARCPFCGDGHTVSDSYSTTLLQHAEEGKDWAQLELAKCYRFGKGVDKDLNKCKEWYSKAAKQGNVAALYSLGDFLLNTPPPPSMRLVQAEMRHVGEAYVWAAARHGVAAAQYQVVWQVLGTSDARTRRWLVLAAAQGYTPAEYLMGQLCAEGALSKRHEKPSDKFYSALYWFRKAAFKSRMVYDDLAAQKARQALWQYMLRAKAKLFGTHDLTMYNAMPEAVFWQSTLVGCVDPRTGEPFDTTCEAMEMSWKVCACCHKQAPSKKPFKRCTKCKATAYCSKTCQARHWKQGHKIDCQGVAEVRLAYKAIHEGPLR